MATFGEPVRGARGDLPAALAAARAQLALVALLLGLAAVAWWSTALRMDGMDAGPGTDLGALGWFELVWVVMMAAMMLPSAAPTVALYAQRVRDRRFAVAFAAGYLVTWSAAGLLAYGLFAGGRAVVGDAVDWDGAGRWLAGGVLVLAAGYQLTPLKDACLRRCRSPVAFLVAHGRRGPLELGARHGAWCVGCCWALMASLFALGVMSLPWMAVVAALIAVEKLLLWERAAPLAIAGLLLGLGVLMIAAPEAVPGLTVPDHGMGMGS